MASAGLGSTGPLFFGVGANPPPSSDPSIQELKKKEMKQKGELKVYSADSDVAQSGSRTKTRTKARTVVLDSKYQLGDEVGRGSSGKVYKALNRDTGDFRAIKEIPIRDVPVARLQAVHREAAGPPYYTIRLLASGDERQTEATRLRAPGDCEAERALFAGAPELQATAAQQVEASARRRAEAAAREEAVARSRQEAAEERASPKP